MILSEKEKLLITDKEFLIAKIEIIKKIHTQLEQTRVELKSQIEKSDFNFSENIDIENGKIFRGENYRSLPYLVLDYPKLFSKESTFAYRTMFWWGNFFSSTLHLEGLELQKYRNSIISNYKLLSKEEIYLSVGETPWEYHYENSNYILLNSNNINLISDCQFLKFSKKFSLSDLDKLPQLSSSYFSLILSILTR